MQNELSSPPLPRNSMKTTYSTILYNVSLGYSKNFGDNIITKPNHMTRVLCQNTGSLEISTNSHKFEVICWAMYDNKVDIGYLVETNTHWQY